MHLLIASTLLFIIQHDAYYYHIQVKQMHLVAPLDKQFSILYGLLADHISENVDYKVI